MSTLNSRLRRIEHKLDIQLQEEELFKNWQEQNKIWEENYSKLSREERREKFANNACAMLKRIETKQDVLLEERGLLDRVNKILSKQARRKLLERRELAKLNDHRDDIKSVARAHYANIKYHYGEPVFIVYNKQAYWIYIEEEKDRVKN